MDRACYGELNGPLVTPTEFEVCQEIVHVYGVHSPNSNTTPRFDHANLLPDADELDDCVLANRISGWMTNGILDGTPRK